MPFHRLTAHSGVEGPAGRSLLVAGRVDEGATRSRREVIAASSFLHFRQGRSCPQHTLIAVIVAGLLLVGRRRCLNDPQAVRSHDYGRRDAQLCSLLEFCLERSLFLLIVRQPDDLMLCR